MRRWRRVLPILRHPHRCVAIGAGLYHFRRLPADFTITSGIRLPLNAPRQREGVHVLRLVAGTRAEVFDIVVGEPPLLQVNQANTELAPHATGLKAGRFRRHFPCCSRERRGDGRAVP